MLPGPLPTRLLACPCCSYEGTYEVNALVAARGATGVSAIKPPKKGPVQVQA